MKYKKLGKTNTKIPALGMGTWDLGVSPKQEVESLKHGIKMGMTFVDTAEMYGTEGIVGNAIKDFEDVFLATKVSPHHFHYQDVIDACNSSLKRLGVKQIDLYQLHWPNPDIPIKETMKAMEKLVEDGKIKYIGVSNFSVDELIEAQKALKDNEIVSNQVKYSPLSRQIEDELIPFCEKEKITIIAYSPFEKGRLFSDSRITDFLKRVGDKYKKTPAQVVLNWLTSKKSVVAIPKASQKNHVDEIGKSVDWDLDKEDLEKIDSFT